MKYSNPLIKNQDLTQPDPYIECFGGIYYVYVTGVKGIGLYSGESLDSLTYQGIIYSVEGEKEYWAPCVYKHGDNFYMYFSSMPENSDDVHLQSIKVVMSKYPDKGFEQCKQLFAPFSIDPHLVANTEGELFMFYSVNKIDYNRAGTIIVCQRMIDPLTPTGEYKESILPTIDQEIFQRDRFEKGQDWYTIEGAFYFYHEGTHFLMYSANAYTNSNYFIGYAFSNDTTQDLSNIAWTKYPDNNTYFSLISYPLLEGAGHNSVIKINNNYYIVYHARDLGRTQGESRTMRMDKLEVNGVKLNVAATLHKDNIVI